MLGREKVCVAIARRIRGGLRWFIYREQLNEKKFPFLSCTLAIKVLSVALTLGVSF